MPRINPTVSDEAVKIYEDKSKNKLGGDFVDRAIKLQHKVDIGEVIILEQGKLFTPEQETRIREIVKEVVK